jgi:hypothetical protein
MKKLLLGLIVTASLFACTNPKETSTATAALPNTTGYTVDSSANIDLIKKSNTAGSTGDLETYKSTYSDSAVFHDNLKKITLSDNLEMVAQFKKSGLTFSIEYGALWETINNKADEKGVSHYVLGYLTVNFKKGDKSVKVGQFQIDAVKDGKIVEEWIVYDPTELMSLMK